MCSFVSIIWALLFLIFFCPLHQTTTGVHAIAMQCLNFCMQQTCGQAQVGLNHN